MISQLKTFFKDCADAIREKSRETEFIKPERMPLCIKNISMKPPSSSGEYYYGVGDDGYATGMAFFGELIPSRLSSNSKITEVTLMEDVSVITSSFFKDAIAIGTVIIKNDLFNRIEAGAFSGSSISKIIGPNGEINELPKGVTEIFDNTFKNCTNLKNLKLHDDVSCVHRSAFELSSVGTTISNTELPANLREIGYQAFYNQQFSFTKIPPKVHTIGSRSFYKNYSITQVSFVGAGNYGLGYDSEGNAIWPTIDSTAFSNCDKLMHIFVPWSEGDVAGAPWGATNATIHYNFTPDILE